MLYDFIEFKSTMLKSYYRIRTEDNENTNIVSNDEQMLSNENELPNDKKATEQFLEFQNTEAKRGYAQRGYPERDYSECDYLGRDCA